MKTNSIPFFNWFNDFTRQELIEILGQNKLLVGTSDTVIGLLAPLAQTGFDLLNTAKGRSEKPYIILMGSPSDAQKFSINSIQAEIIMRNCWPGPLTILVTAKEDIPHYLKSAKNVCALRVPAHEPLRILAAQMGGLFSTSANKTRKLVPNAIQQIDADILSYVGGIVIDTNEVADNDQLQFSTMPSTIIDCTTQVPYVVREGAFSLEKIEQLTGIDLRKS